MTQNYTVDTQVATVTVNSYSDKVGFGLQPLVGRVVEMVITPCELEVQIVPMELLQQEPM